jgi:predicted nucleic-acid-binding protein
MIGLDTNVLLAWLLSEQARALPPAPAYRITHVVLAELIWVLDRSMHYSRARQIQVLDSLRNAADIAFDRSAVVDAALEDFRKGKADFADNLIARDNAAGGCVSTFTLDKMAAREPGFTRLRG